MTSAWLMYHFQSLPSHWLYVSGNRLKLIRLANKRGLFSELEINSPVFHQQICQKIYNAIGWNNRETYRCINLMRVGHSLFILQLLVFKIIKMWSSFHSAKTIIFTPNCRSPEIFENDLPEPLNFTAKAATLFHWFSAKL